MRLTHLLLLTGFISVSTIGSMPANAATTLVQHLPGIKADDGYVKCGAGGGGCAVGMYSTPAIGRGVDNLQNNAILSFDTSSIPDDAIITRAYLTVSYSSGAGDPWEGGANPLYVDIKNGTFGTTAIELSDWNAAATASAVATIPYFYTGSMNSANFNASGLAAINRTGKTQLRLRFSRLQAGYGYPGSYRFINEGENTTLHVEFQMPATTADVPRAYWPTAAWQRKTPSEVGMNPTRINNLVSRIQANAYGNVHSLLVTRHGYIVSENYFGEGGATIPHDLESTTKSISSVLTGIAMDKGYFNINDKVVNVFNNYPNIQNADIYKNAISVENILTQKHGFYWREVPLSNDTNTPMIASNDWIKFVLDLPMAAVPGTLFNYSTGNSSLMGGMIKAKTPYKPEDFAKAFLFDPIGIKSQEWWCKDSLGMIHTGGCLKLTSQDLARFGFLILNNGKWNGQQVVSKAYLDAAYNPQTYNQFHGSYGYQMWLVPATVNGHTYWMRSSVGAGGQYSFVVPELDLVVVSTAWNIDPNTCSTSCILGPVRMMEEDIIPAALGQ
jgi:CubicO group peptidase (beta-lactamase class C family)